MVLLIDSTQSSFDDRRNFSGLSLVPTLLQNFKDLVPLCSHCAVLCAGAGTVKVLHSNNILYCVDLPHVGLGY